MNHGQASPLPLIAYTCTDRLTWQCWCNGIVGNVHLSGMNGCCNHASSWQHAKSAEHGKCLPVRSMGSCTLVQGLQQNLVRESRGGLANMPILITDITLHLIASCSAPVSRHWPAKDARPPAVSIGCHRCRCQMREKERQAAAGRLVAITSLSSLRLPYILAAHLCRTRLKDQVQFDAVIRSYNSQL